MEILSEVYRPKTINECILTDEIKDVLNGYIKSGNLPSLLFVGGPGCGKTTSARAIANEMGADVLFINASMNANIDMIRTQMTQFASTVSFTGAKKITILDEIDGNNISPAVQQSLRGFLEEFGKNHSIIFTANNPNKIIDAIKSRCPPIDFKISKKDKPVIAAKFMKRVLSILETEKIEYEKDAVAALVMKRFPDFRSVLMTIQAYAAGGKIDAGILSTLSEDSFNALVAALKAKKFNDVRKWVGEHSDLDSTEMYRLFYDTATEKMESKSIPELILQLGEFSYRDYFSLDKEIARMSFLTTIMLSQSIVWK